MLFRILLSLVQAGIKKVSWISSKYSLDEHIIPHAICTYLSHKVIGEAAEGQKL